MYAINFKLATVFLCSDIATYITVPDLLTSILIPRRFTPSGGGRSRRGGVGGSVGRIVRGGDGGGRGSKSSSRAQSEEVSLNSSSDHSDTEGSNQLVR